ncbi:MAG: SulP family inorganic anion transporter [Edaphobacter sp.]|uniref:SulP family inorganic anion transporter n=1 Tax=Edaphobacter sp. TaxID=1934404 RepID=UPI00239B4A38|nr:SulP family inorganic anion transporter [Edaphobacter sp.]MDE1178783.1 SulP family inorganic anion transporter [Edaphobacter sp.]
MNTSLHTSLSASEVKTNLLSGLTVALALVPEAIAFALVAHVNPLVGLYAAFIMCFLTAAFGGRPGMISGATGSTAVVMVALVLQHGVQYLFAAVVLMGVLQVIFGLLRLGKFIRMVPHPVMLGFVNGLAIVIFLAQFGHFKVKDAAGVEHWMAQPQMMVMLGLIAVTMAIIYLLPKLTTAVPSSLVAIIVVASIVIFSGLHTRTVGDMASIRGGFPPFHVPAVPWNLATLRIVLPYAFILAGVGLIETLLTLNLVDEITQTRGRPNRECLAQGAGNIVSGFLGAMGGCAMIGQTMINISSGARRRLSGITAGLCLLSFILFGSSLIERIPIAALVGVMFVVSEKTFEWGTFRVFGKVPRHDALVIIAVTVVTVFTDLATAVILGILISALVFAWEHAKRIGAKTRTDEMGRKIYELNGTLFFASAASFGELFTPADDPDDVIVEFRSARVADHSALEAIDRLAERYQQMGKTLHLRHLSADCQELLQRARPLIEVNLLEDPQYHVADDRLG